MAVPGVSLELLDWRRRVFTLYAEVRAAADPAAAHEHWRAVRDELLRSHPQSPIAADRRGDFPGARYAPYDASLRFELVVDADVPPARLEVPTGTDGVVPFERIGVLHLPGLGDLDVWWLASYGGGVFVPIKDAGAGRSTYGGGRYLLDTVKGADLGGDALGRDALGGGDALGGDALGGHSPGWHGRRSRLVVDLNFAYNPSCAYDPAWACPLAQAGNTLPVPVHAGELS